MNAGPTKVRIAAVASALAMSSACSIRTLVGDDEAATSTGTDGSTGAATITASATAEASTHEPTFTSSADASTSSDPSGPGFITQPDLDGTTECSIWAQDCPPGEKCMPWANDGGNVWNALRCSPVADDPGQPGDPCAVEGSGVSGIDDCELGAMCWNVDPETLMGRCIAFCTGSEANPVCENACEQCNIAGESVLALCLASCNPIAQDCYGDEGCYPVGDTFTCAPDAGEIGGPGDPCEYLNACNPGLFCANVDVVPDCAGPQGCCAPFCDAAATDVCDALLPGTVCVPWYEEGMGPDCIDGTIGACVLP